MSCSLRFKTLTVQGAQAWRAVTTASREGLERLYTTPGSWTDLSGSSKAVPIKTQGPIREHSKTEGQLPRAKEECRGDAETGAAEGRTEFQFRRESEYQRGYATTTAGTA